jgi:hypothetical protein
MFKKTNKKVFSFCKPKNGINISFFELTQVRNNIVCNQLLLENFLGLVLQVFERIMLLVYPSYQPLPMYLATLVVPFY